MTPPPKPKPIKPTTPVDFIRRLRWLFLAIGFLLIAVVTIAWATGSLQIVAYSIQFAEPAGKEHLENVVAVSPDSARGDAAARNFINVAFMTRGYCYAQSQALDTKALGGFGKSDNAGRAVWNSKARGLYLLAEPTVAEKFGSQMGMRLVLVNATSDLLSFSASDSRLNIIQEAQDEDGKWKPVEYLPRSWCGNSYHRVFLGPDHFWAFGAPRYQGKFQTSLRFTLTLSDGSQVISNTFSGSVNPEQFTEKEGHAPTNIMDSYDE